MNAFLQLAEEQISAPRQRLWAKAKKAIAERRTTFRIWRQARAEQCDALLAGPRGDMVRELISFLGDMTDAAPLISHAEQWREADADTRFEILRLIDTAIVALRERHDLPPFDDPLPDEQPNVFLVIRGVLA